MLTVSLEHDVQNDTILVLRGSNTTRSSEAKKIATGVRKLNYWVFNSVHYIA